MAIEYLCLGLGVTLLILSIKCFFLRKARMRELRNELEYEIKKAKKRAKEKKGDL